MLQNRIMPVLLYKNGRLVKTVKFQQPDYIGDPVNAVKIYNDKAVDELVFLDISATIEAKTPDFDKISEIAGVCFMPLSYGGGINNVADMKKIFNLGVEKIIICSTAVTNPNLISEAANLFGSQSVMVAIDIKKNRGKYEVFSHSGTRGTRLDPLTFAKEMEKKGAGEIFLNAIDRDGTWMGYDYPLIRKITQNISIPVIACGGAGKVSDFGRAIKAGALATGCGAMVVYQKKGCGVLINFPSQEEIKKVLKNEK